MSQRKQRKLRIYRQRGATAFSVGGTRNVPGNVTVQPGTLEIFKILWMLRKYFYIVLVNNYARKSMEFESQFNPVQQKIVSKANIKDMSTNPEEQCSSSIAVHQQQQQARSATVTATSCCRNNSGRLVEREETPVEIKRKELFTAMYNQDTDTFRSILQEHPFYLTECYGGYCLIHHLIDHFWQEGLVIYKEIMCGNMSLTTADVLLSLNKSIPLYIVGGRNILHLLAGKVDEESQAHYQHLCERFPSLTRIKDNNGMLPSDIANRWQQERNAETTKIRSELEKARHREEYLQVKNRLYLDFSDVIAFGSGDITDVTPVLHDRQFQSDVVMHSFHVSHTLLEQLSHDVEGLEDSIPNSMHRYGKLLLPEMKDSVYRMVYTLFSQDCQLRKQIEKISAIHAFYIKYSAATPVANNTATDINECSNDEKANDCNGETKPLKSTNRSLGKHRDDSSITINLCLRNTSQSGKLVIDDILPQSEVEGSSNYVYTHETGKGILHQGNLVHHVEEFVDGERENIIIWVRF